MAEILCKETSCAFHQGGECGLKAVTLERTEIVAKKGALLICQQYEAQHISEWLAKVLTKVVISDG